MNDPQHSRKKVEDTKNILDRSSYSLYAYDISKSQLKCNAEESIISETNVNDSSDSFSLSVLATNLNAEQETVVRTYVSKRLIRGMMIEGPGNGNVSEIEFSLDDVFKTEAVCYISLLSKEGVDSISMPDGEFECVQSSVSQHYIVCLITEANGILDFFKPELTSYLASLYSLLDPGLKKNLEAVKKYLENWYEDSLMYICRCISCLGKDVAVFLQLALCGGHLKVCTSDKHVKADYERFFDSCCLSDLLHSSNPKSNDNPNLISVDLVLNNEGHKFTDIPAKCTDYCEKWANALIENNDGDPLILKHIVEDFRLKTIQDMNSLKRMLSQAENDHYALFRTYIFLENSGYGDSLLQHAKREEYLNNNPDTMDVINILEEFI